MICFHWLMGYKKKTGIAQMGYGNGVIEHLQKRTCMVNKSDQVLGQWV